MPFKIGSVNSAGVSVSEEEAGAAITPSGYGTTVYVGALEKGNVGELLDCPKLNQFLRKCGSFFDDSEFPEAAFDFYEASEGGGRLYAVRVTDGTEVQAIDFGVSRHSGRGEYANRDVSGFKKNTLFKVSAKNGGRWGGAKQAITFDFVSAPNLTETTAFLLDAGWLPDQFKGATLRVLGVTSRSYEVIGNTANTITVKSDSTMASDLAAGADSTNKKISVVLDTATRKFTSTGVIAGDKQSLSLRWKDGEENQTSLFGLDILVDEQNVANYNNLSLDPTSKWYIDDVINKDPNNDFIEIEIYWTSTFDAANRPANWQGTYKGFSGATMTAEIASVVSVAPIGSTDPGFVADFSYPAKTIKSLIRLSFTSSTNFEVRGLTQAAPGVFGDLPDGTVGTPYTTTLAANGYTLLDNFPGFTVFDGVDAWANGDTVTIDVDPFAVDLLTGEGLLSGQVLIDGNDPNSERLTIASNTASTITFVNAPTASPTVDGDIASTITSEAISFPTTGDVLNFNTDITGQVQLTYGVEATIAALVITLNADAIANGLPALFFDDGGDLGVNLPTTYATASSNKGHDQFFEALGGEGGDVAFTPSTSKGVQGDFFRVEAPKELFGGYDGDTPTDSDYLNAYNVASSVINRLRGRNVGLAKLATPGVTATAVQKAGLNYAKSRGYQYRIEIPANYTEETAVIDYVNNTIGRSDFGKVNFPSYGNMNNRSGNGTVLQTLTGVIHGLEAKTASVFKGYHKAAAGTDVLVPNLVTLPTGEKVLDEEILNPQGINVVKKRQGNFILWGGRTISLNSEWKFSHAREYISHIQQVLFENFDYVIFKLNDVSEREKLFPVFDAFFLPEWKKHAIVGGKLSDAASIKIDSDNNTLATIADGDANVEISLSVVGVIERLNITVSKAGVSSGT